MKAIAGRKQRAKPRVPGRKRSSNRTMLPAPKIHKAPPEKRKSGAVTSTQPAARTEGASSSQVASVDGSRRAGQRRERHSVMNATSDKTIGTIDIGGISFAAIQGLHELVKEKETEIAKLAEEKDAEIAELKQRLAKLEALVNALAQRQAQEPSQR